MDSKLHPNLPPDWHPDWLKPNWPVAGLSRPAEPGVGAVMTTRHGGVSAAPFDGFNLRDSIGDAPQAVAQNRAQLARAVGATPVWLNQVHGARVVRLDATDAAPGAPVHDADASVTSVPGVACTVLVADCLPVLFAAPHGRAVGAAHAGWRGLAGGVLEATLAAVCDAAQCAPAQVQVWLGACIGPTRFEVGADVLAAFSSSTSSDLIANISANTGAMPVPAPRFVPHAPGKFLADLAGLAQDRLRAAGAVALYGANACTVNEPSRFFSFRRDRVTGRMAALVWLRQG